MRLSFKIVTNLIKQVQFWSKRDNLEIGSELHGFPSSAAFSIYQASKLFTEEGEMWTPTDDEPISEQVNLYISHGCLPNHELLMCPSDRKLTDPSRKLPILNTQVISGDVVIWFSTESNRFVNDFTLANVEAGIVMQASSVLLQYNIIPRNDSYTRSSVLWGPTFLSKPRTAFWVRTFDNQNIQLESGEILLIRKIGDKFCVIRNGDASMP